jgi:hypothetical protein
MTLIYKGETIEDSATTLLGRLPRTNGTAAVPADVAALRLKVYENKAGTLIVPEGEDAETYDGTDLTVATVILDPPVPSTADVRWTEDDPYNVKIDLHGSHFPEGGKTYQVEVRVTPTVGDPSYLLWQVKTTNIWSE